MMLNHLVIQLRQHGSNSILLGMVRLGLVDMLDVVMRGQARDEFVLLVEALPDSHRLRYLEIKPALEFPPIANSKQGRGLHQQIILNVNQQLVDNITNQPDIAVDDLRVNVPLDQHVYSLRLQHHIV